MRRIFANDFSSLQSAIQADEALRQRAYEYEVARALGQRLRDQERKDRLDELAMAERQRRFSNTLAERQQQYNRDVFDEQKRQYDEGRFDRQWDSVMRGLGRFEGVGGKPASVQKSEYDARREAAMMGIDTGDPVLDAIANQTRADNRRLRMSQQSIADIENERGEIESELLAISDKAQDTPAWKRWFSKSRYLRYLPSNYLLTKALGDPGSDVDSEIDARDADAVRAVTLRRRLERLPSRPAAQVLDENTIMDARTRRRVPIIADEQTGTPFQFQMPDGSVYEVPVERAGEFRSIFPQATIVGLE